MARADLDGVAAFLHDIISTPVPDAHDLHPGSGPPLDEEISPESVARD